MIVTYLVLGVVFLVAIYAVGVEANLSEQRARMACNQMYRNLGLSPLYTIDLKIIRNVDK